MKWSLTLLVVCLWIQCQAQEETRIPEGQPAQELVGKWCLINPSANSVDAITNSCITLNGDGSYEIRLDRAGSVMASNFISNIQDSDFGAWWVVDSRIYYRSTSQGTGSFLLQKSNHPRIENTATIVLDGIVFCAAFTRDPW